MEDSVHKHRISFGVFTPSLINTFCVTSAGERNCIFLQPYTSYFPDYNRNYKIVSFSGV